MRLVVTDPRFLGHARADLVALLARVDAAASRFSPGSALSRANALAGRPVPVPHLLVDLVDAALDAAARTAGAVDPTLGLAMQRAGYDRDIADIRGRHLPAVQDAPDRPAPRAGVWRRVRLHREAGLLTVPSGTALDLGATAKAWTADRAASAIAARYGTGVLVELGGDLAVAGPSPDGGWRVRVAEHEGGPGQVVVVHHGGLATSTTTGRRWTQGGRAAHHILDPATGQSTDGPWRTVSVHAVSALTANTASTAAIVGGAGALERSAGSPLAARLVDHAGVVSLRGGWPPLQAPLFPADRRPAGPNPALRGEEPAGASA